MRHRKKRVYQLSAGAQKTENVMRNLITSLLKEWQIVTTQKRGKALAANMDKFIADLLNVDNIVKSDADRRRETIRRIKKVVWTEAAGKKLLDDLLPRIKESGKRSGFARVLKLANRAGDGAVKVVVSLKI